MPQLRSSPTLVGCRGGQSAPLSSSSGPSSRRNPRRGKCIWGSGGAPNSFRLVPSHGVMRSWPTPQAISLHRTNAPEGRSVTARSIPREGQLRRALPLFNCNGGGPKPRLQAQLPSYCALTPALRASPSRRQRVLAHFSRFASLIQKLSQALPSLAIGRGKGKSANCPVPK